MDGVNEEETMYSVLYIIFCIWILIGGETQISVHKRHHNFYGVKEEETVVTEKKKKSDPMDDWS